jgi:hypothetical protein
VTGAIAVEMTGQDRAGGLSAAELLAVAADPVRWAVLAPLSAGGCTVCTLEDGSSGRRGTRSW